MEKNLGQIVHEKFTFAQMQDLPLSDLNILVVEFRSTDSALKTQVDEIREKRLAPITTVGKILSAYQTKFAAEQVAGNIPSSTTFAAYFEEKAGSKFEKMGRALQCSRVFSRLVCTNLLSETDYDVVSEDWLYVVSTILDEILKANRPDDGITPPGNTILDVVNILKIRPKKGAAALRDIKNKLQGRTTVSGDGRGPEMDVANATALLARILSMDIPNSAGPIPGLLLAASAMHEHVKTADMLPRTVAKSFWLAIQGFRADFPLELAREFFAEAELNSRPVTVIPAPEPVAVTPPVALVPEKADELATQTTEEWLKTAYPDFGDVPENDAADMIRGVDLFAAREGRLPENTDELEAFVQSLAVPA